MEYFVRTDGNNSNTGTSNSSGGAWLTLAKASSTIVAGDTCYVQAGTYAEVLETGAAGSSGNLIRFIAQGQVNIRGISVDHDFNEVNGFRITTSAAVLYAAITFNADNIRIVNNTVYNMSVMAIRCIDSNTGLAPAVANWPTGVYIGQNSISGIDTVSKACNLIFNDSMFEGNMIDAISADAINLWGDNNIISGNTITNITQDLIGDENHNDFIQTWFAAAGYHALNNIIERNLVRACYAQICNLEDGNQNASFGGWIFRNNIFADIALNGNPGIENCKWYNNTFYRAPYTPGNATPIIFFNQSGFHSAGGMIRNNLFVNCGASSGDGIVRCYSVGYDADYDFATGLEPYFDAPGTAPNPPFNETNGINGGDPLLSDPENGAFALLDGSPAIGAGVDLSAEGFSTDFNGNLRTGAWDIGAIQFDGEIDAVITVGTLIIG